MRIKKLCVFTLLFLLISVLLVAAPQQQYQEKVKVINRITDFRVLDRQGNPVKGLAAKDFKIKIDGKPVSIVALDEYTGIPLDSPEAKSFELAMAEFEAKGGTPPQPPTKPRYFYFLLNVHDSGDRANIENIKTALKMVDEILLPHDRAAVLAYNGTMRILQNLTSDKAAVKDAINRARMPRMSFMYYPIPEEIQAKEKRSFPKIAGMNSKPRYAIDNVSNTDPVDSTGNMGKARSLFNSEKVLAQHMLHKEIEFRNFISAMTALAKSVKSIPAKKNLIMFSEGNNIYDPDQMSTELKIATPSWQKLDRQFNAANVTIYTVKRGLGISQWESNYYDTSEYSVIGQPIMSRVNIPTMRNSREGSLRLQAHVTGGKFYDTAIADEKIIADLITESAFYYTATFVPPQGKPGRLQKLEIQCLIPGYEVKHRSSLYVEKRFNEMSSKEKELHLAEVMANDSVDNELGVTICSNEIPVPKEKLLLISLSLDGKKIVPDHQGRKEVEFLVISESMKGDELYRKHATFYLDNKEDDQLYFSIAVPLLESEKTKVNFVLRDNATGARSNWRGVFQKSEKTDAVKLFSPMLFSSKEENSGWQQQIKEERGTSEYASFVDSLFGKRVLGQEGCPQGENAELVFLVGNLKGKVDFSKIEPKVGFYLDPRKEESYSLIPEETRLSKNQELGCLVVRSIIPLGYAQKERGELFVAVAGVAPGRAILSPCEYHIASFRQSRALELSKAKKILEMK